MSNVVNGRFRQFHGWHSETATRRRFSRCRLSCNSHKQGTTSLHVETERARIEPISNGCVLFEEINHLDATKLDKWLAHEMKRRSDLGIITLSHHLRAIKSFIQWLADNHRTKLNPFNCLAPLNIEKYEARHPRRALDETEFHRLVTTTRQPNRIDGKRSPTWRCNGEDRYHLYLTAAYTQNGGERDTFILVRNLLT